MTIKKNTHTNHSMMEQFRNIWFILVTAAGIIYWAARQDSSLTDIKENRTKISMLETRIINQENGLNKLQVKLDNIGEDLTLIKKAVLK